MPQLAIAPLLFEIIGAGVGATELGLNLAGVGKPSTPDPTKQLDAAKEAQATADSESKRKAILASLANAQEQGGGSLGPTSLVDLASVISGLPGEATGTSGKKALADYLGTPSSSSGDTLVGATYGLSGSQG